MPAGLTEKDDVYATSETWHGEEKLREVIDKNPFDWEPTEAPVYIGEGDKQRESEKYKAIVCDQTGLELYIGSDRYEIIKNQTIWDLIQHSLDGVGYEVTCVGSHSGRKKVWFSLSLDDHQEYLINGDEFKNTINFLTSHDGSMNLVIRDSSIRVVCSNTFNAALGEGAGALNLKVKHSKSAADKIANLPLIIDQIMQKREDYYDTLTGFADQAMSLNDANNLIAGWIGDKKKQINKSLEDHKVVGTRTKNTIEGITELFTDGIGCTGDSRYSLFNAVTQYYTSGRGTGSDEGKKYFRSEFGGANDKKGDFYWNCLNKSDEEVEKIAKRGEQYLSASPAW